MGYNKGKDNPMYRVCRKGHGLGRKVSEETKKKLRLSLLISQPKGKDHPNWKGGQFTDGYGYVHILKPDHPRANNKGYVHRSHLVAEKKLGRYLYPDEIPHHENEIKNDDRPENIEVTTQNKHTSSHNKKREVNQIRNTFGQYTKE